LFKFPFAFAELGAAGFEVVGFVGLRLLLSLVPIDGLVELIPEPLEAPEPAVAPMLPLPAAPMLPLLARPPKPVPPLPPAAPPLIPAPPQTPSCAAAGTGASAGTPCATAAALREGICTEYDDRNGQRRAEYHGR
jgi:hypothetical protein